MILMSEILKNALNHVGHEISFRASQNRFCALAQFILKNFTLTRGADISAALEKPAFVTANALSKYYSDKIRNC